MWHGLRQLAVTPRLSNSHDSAADSEAAKAIEARKTAGSGALERRSQAVRTPPRWRAAMPETDPRLSSVKARTFMARSRICVANATSQALPGTCALAAFI